MQGIIFMALTFPFKLTPWSLQCYTVVYCNGTFRHLVAEAAGSGCRLPPKVLTRVAVAVPVLAERPGWHMRWFGAILRY